MTSRQPGVSEYVDGIRSGNIAMLGKAITLVESTLAKHQETAEQIIEQCLPFSGNSLRIGITGVPGVGKSSFIEQFGVYLADMYERKVAVLAIDPTSSISKGSILGDKTRMEKLSVHPRAFIRPTPSGHSLGGVARKTRESIYLCEAAGFDTIIVETVGVGQSETAVHSMVDFFLLLMLSGAGDELQGIKRGIMEMADALFITKADGENESRARLAAVEYKRAMHLLPPHPAGWIPQTGTCSALSGKGLDNVWEVILSYHNHTQLNGYFAEKRRNQSVFWMDETINEQIRTLFFQNEQVRQAYDAYVEQLKNSRITSYKAARELMSLFAR
jgi:LAO/AO transport system kinase